MVFGARGIRNSIIKSYRKHLRMYQEEVPEKGVSPHHASLHGALVLRYAASYRAVPEAVVWLELLPFLGMDDEQSVQALAEYVVSKEKPQEADLPRLIGWVREGLSSIDEKDQAELTELARSWGFRWTSWVD